MKQPFNNLKIVSLNYPTKYKDIFRFQKLGNLYVSDVNNMQYIDKIHSDISAINYLDHFIILLPSTQIKQAEFWLEFYKLYGEEYENIINIKKNIKSIQDMLHYIEMQCKLDENSVVLDYGCGSGIAKCVKVNYKLIGYEPVAEMRKQAIDRDYSVLDYNEFVELPNGFCSAGFANYVFHMSVSEKEIDEINKKLKPNSVFLANFYKSINIDSVNRIFKKYNYEIHRISLSSDNSGDAVYEYRKR